MRRLIAKGKTRKARRHVPLSERVLALLKNIQQGQSKEQSKQQSKPHDGWVFPSKKSPSGYVGLSSLEHKFRTLARTLGIPDALKLYCARHTFGTVAMAETKDPGLVREVMGHESLSTTMGYVHRKLPRSRPSSIVAISRSSRTELCRSSAVVNN